MREEGIDIQSGAFEVSRTLVPWVRVQHVDTRRGVLEQSFGLSTVVVHTAAGSHTIPLLPQAEAEALRERIAGLARADDVDDEPLDLAPSSRCSTMAEPRRLHPSAVVDLLRLGAAQLRLPAARDRRA